MAAIIPERKAKVTAIGGEKARGLFQEYDQRTRAAIEEKTTGMLSNMRGIADITEARLAQKRGRIASSQENANVVQQNVEVMRLE